MTGHIWVAKVWADSSWQEAPDLYLFNSETAGRHGIDLIYKDQKTHNKNGPLMAETLVDTVTEVVYEFWFRAQNGQHVKFASLANKTPLGITTRITLEQERI